MNYIDIEKKHVGQKVLIQAWGYSFPMETPPLPRTIKEVSHGSTFQTEEDVHGDGSHANRDCNNWKIAVP